MIGDKTLILNFSHQYIEKVLPHQEVSEDHLDQVVGFMEYMLCPKYTVGMNKKHKARNLINKYKQTLTSYS